MNTDIKMLRQKKGLSQLTLSFIADISRFRLNLFERGLIQLREDELVKVRKALSKTLNRPKKEMV